VLADRVQLQQVALNLVLNSIDAMSLPGCEPRDLLIKTEQTKPSEMQATFRDTGVGINPDKRDLIFEPFVTTKKGGLGLGLSISRTIVETHGGRLWSTPNANGPGCSFCFTVPVS
jgi:two-component system sensor kinase FixL